MLTAWSLPVRARDPASIRAAARRITAGPEFRPPRRSIPSAAWYWFSDHVGHWLDQLFGSGGFGFPAGAFVAVLGAGALAIIVWALWRARGKGRTSARRRDSGVVVSETGRRRTSEQWLTEAAACEARGAWRDGVRARYRALLASLAEAGLIQERPGRTSGEHLREVSARAPGAALAMAAATDLFERCWYGDITAGPDDRDRLILLSARISAAAQADADRPGPSGATPVGAGAGPAGL